ncbi:hypothetical protein C2G38_2153128 [Gigaspora rosea]|uniref:Uncharacterized protein n=1 Tax=Gigaspora rosea TaxID=44941 RepID=A0A397W8A0_9GLOM|nr:hypothetical protein C2G38_2153128 [Gigaspora rosea]
MFWDIPLWTWALSISAGSNIAFHGVSWLESSYLSGATSSNFRVKVTISSPKDNERAYLVDELCVFKLREH